MKQEFEEAVSRLLGSQQAARKLGVSVPRLKVFLKTGRLRYIRTPLGSLIDPADIERFQTAREPQMRKWRARMRRKATG